MATTTKQSKRHGGAKAKRGTKRATRTRAARSKETTWAPKLVESPRGGTMLDLRKRLRMTRETFGRLADVSVRTLAGVESGRPPSQRVRRKMTEIRRITRALGEVVAPDAVGRWLETPNEAFGRAKPLELIERGETDRIWQMIYTLRSGGVS